MLVSDQEPIYFIFYFISFLLYTIGSTSSFPFRYVLFLFIIFNKTCCRLVIILSIPSYAVNTLLSDGKMILLVLNTMYWNDNRYTDPLVDQIAASQMQWFNNQLQMAKNQRKKVLIMSHIPPGWVVVPLMHGLWKQLLQYSLSFLFNNKAACSRFL